MEILQLHRANSKNILSPLYFPLHFFSMKQAKSLSNQTLAYETMTKKDYFLTTLLKTPQFIFFTNENQFL